MNVLILTPDRVGSTLLQRLLTVYMLRRQFDKPVINLHELTNGLEKYYNTTLNQEVLGKPKGTEWGYFQSLAEIEDLLNSVDHYKTSRLAHYHLVNRRDTLSEQLKFYDYLNKNFYIIGCRRNNLLEHALSWIINAHSKKLNVYSPQEKINSFFKIYSDGIECTRDGLENYLKKYKQYINWSDNYFNVQSYFEYDTNIHRIEDYILNLDFMKGSINNRWEDMFGQSFSNYNTCHKILPDLVLADHKTGIEINLLPDLISRNKYNQFKGANWIELSDLTPTQFDQLPVPIQQEIDKIFQLTQLKNKGQIKVPAEIHKFLTDNLDGYRNTKNQIDNLVNDGFLVTPIPIKLQSLKEKKEIIKNFSQCVDWYNTWVIDNEFGVPYSDSELNQLILKEDLNLNKEIDKYHQLT